jgi:hypothetical protein
MAFPNGNEYEGTFVNGHLHGEGIFKFADKSKYVGEFQNGFIHGKGKFTNWNDELSKPDAP